MKKVTKKILVWTTAISLMLTNSVPVLAANTETFYDKSIRYAKTRLSDSMGQVSTYAEGADYVKARLSVKYRLNNTIKYYQGSNHSGKITVSYTEDVGSSSYILALSSYHEACFYIQGASRIWSRETPYS